MLYLARQGDCGILLIANNTDADDTAELEEESPSESSPSTSSG